MYKILWLNNSIPSKDNKYKIDIRNVTRHNHLDYFPLIQLHKIPKI